jgi:hypothetical protein
MEAHRTNSMFCAESKKNMTKALAETMKRKGGKNCKIWLTSNEKRVSSEHASTAPVFGEPADAVTSVAGRSDGGKGDVAQGEALAMGRRTRHGLTVFSTNDLKVWRLKLFALNGIVSPLSLLV